MSTGKYIRTKPQSAEQRKKISESLKRIHRSKEWGENISKAKKGKKLSAQARKNMKAGRQGIKFSREHKENISKALRESEIRKEWYKNKPKLYGKDNPSTWPEVRRKISLASGGTGVPGEVSEYGAEFDSKLKEQIRFRDGYKCRVCGCPQVECRRQLNVHHIDYDKKNNKHNNLMCLCDSCHAATNHNRDYWRGVCLEIL